nr:hypothetical protein Iba_chr14cCG11870 [Ipomoea batatas]
MQLRTRKILSTAHDTLGRSSENRGSTLTSTGMDSSTPFGDIMVLVYAQMSMGLTRSVYMGELARLSSRTVPAFGNSARVVSHGSIYGQLVFIARHPCDKEIIILLMDDSRHFGLDSVPNNGDIESFLGYGSCRRREGSVKE